MAAYHGKPTYSELACSRRLLYLSIVLAVVLMVAGILAAHPYPEGNAKSCSQPDFDNTSPATRISIVQHAVVFLHWTTSAGFFWPNQTYWTALKTISKGITGVLPYIRCPKIYDDVEILGAASPCIAVLLSLSMTLIILDLFVNILSSHLLGAPQQQQKTSQGVSWHEPQPESDS